MLALTLLATLATGEIDLPRTLSEDVGSSSVLGFSEAQAQKAHDVTWYVGGHLGVASSFDSDDAAFVIGGQGRVRLFPWLGVEASAEFQTSQSYESGDIQVWMFDVQVSALFYLPVDWPVKPYGLVGVGLYYQNISYSGALGYLSDKTAVEPGFHIGFGAEYALDPKIMFDAGFRFVFLSHPGGLAGNDLNYWQFTVGILFKIG